MAPSIILMDQDLESQADENSDVIIDFFMPNGIFIPFRVSLAQPVRVEYVKKKLFKEAENYPLYEQLKRPESYILKYLSKQALGQDSGSGWQDVDNEEIFLCDLQLSASYFKVVERVCKDPAHETKKNIESLIGTRCLRSIDSADYMSEEIDDFRIKMDKFCFEITEKFNNDMSDWAKFAREHPRRLVPPSYIPDNVETEIPVKICRGDENTGQIQKTVLCNINDPPMEVLKKMVEKWYRGNGRISYNDHQSFVLKVLGYDDYIYDLPGQPQTPIKLFRYVCDCLVEKIEPSFVLLHKEPLLCPTKSVRKSSKGDVGHIHRNRTQKKEAVYSWGITDPFTFTLSSITNIDLPSGSKVILYAGLYYGLESLEVFSSNEYEVKDKETQLVSFPFKFTTQIEEVPSMCRLCFALHSRIRRARETEMVAWVNIPMFDFRLHLLQGDYQLFMWPATENARQIGDQCYPIGPVSRNPEGKTATTITIHVPKFQKHRQIAYPPRHKVLEVASKNMEEEGSVGSVFWHASKSHLKQIEDIFRLDPANLNLGSLAEQEKDLIWKLRYECRDNYKDNVLHVLASVKWSSYKDVAKMLALLQSWPTLPIDMSLTLLDFVFPDEFVREIATDWLQDISDDVLSQYMLQLVQSLKFESYLFNPLAKFLMSRCLTNEHLGHKFFWHLRSEMHNDFVVVQFGLLIEMYLKYSKDHLPKLIKQHELLSKLNFLGQLCKTNQKILKTVDGMAKDLKQIISQKKFNEALCNLNSPITPLLHVGNIVVEKLRVMKSKKKPLLLNWKNIDEGGHDIVLMYKNGDDLRQDMLTLQVFTIMDCIWKSEKLNLRMNPYLCVATGFNEGMLEIVQHSKTIAKIQVENGGGVGKKDSLYNWLKNNNNDAMKLEAALEEFFYSCVGYTVATYILGIGDRHNDNIMITESGQLFHIDFGHFLGNIKQKYGFKRERVPFILTSHFIYIITKGDQNPGNLIRFQRCCEQAYLSIRRHSRLLVRLFTMMIIAGIPQLMSIQDVEYLKESLLLQGTEDEALKHFQQKFKEAQDNSWSTNLNWWIHIKNVT